MRERSYHGRLLPDGRGFDSRQLHQCDVARHRQGPEPASGFGFLVFLGSVGSSWSADGGAGAVVAVVGVEGEVAEDFAGGGVDDADVVAVDEEDDAGSVEGSAEADVVH